MAEKDIGHKTLEELNDVFSDIVNVLLFNGEEVLGEEELTDVSPRSNYTSAGKRREQERDVAKIWRGSEIRLALIGFENQTEEDADMPLRVLGYDGAEYRGQLSKGNRGPRYPVITLVLYFGFEHRWRKAKSLHERLWSDDRRTVDERLKPYISDYRINVFEIAYLDDETAGKFKSDFKFVVDYVRQMQQTGDYIPPDEKIVHVFELLSLMTALTKDDRFEKNYELIQEKEDITMRVAALDRAEERGEARGEARGLAMGESRLGNLVNRLMKDGRTDDVLKASTDEEARKQFYREYGIID